MSIQGAPKCNCTTVTCFSVEKLRIYIYASRAPSRESISHWPWMKDVGDGQEIIMQRLHKISPHVVFLSSFLTKVKELHGGRASTRFNIIGVWNNWTEKTFMFFYLQLKLHFVFNASWHISTCSFKIPVHSKCPVKSPLFLREENILKENCRSFFFTGDGWMRYDIL